MGYLKLIFENDKVTMYSPVFSGETDSEFDKFLNKAEETTERQLLEYFGAIFSAIDFMQRNGAQERRFRPEGQRIKAMPVYVSIKRINRNVGKVRLYCIRYSDELLILGNGGVTTSQKYEDDPQMLSIVTKLRDVDKTIMREIRKAKVSPEDTESVKLIIKDIEI